MALAALSQALDQLEATDPFSYADPESIKALVALKVRLERVVAMGVAAFDAAQEWAVDGAMSSASWLASESALSLGEARAQRQRGRGLALMPLVDFAWAQGTIGLAQVDQLIRAQRGAEALFARDEHLLVGMARELSCSQFTTALAYWQLGADPDGADAADMARRARRHVALGPSAFGMYLGTMAFDPISGAIVSKELIRLEQVLFDADWAQAKAELGREPKVHELSRTSGQRRCDALVEMASRSQTAPQGGRRPEPLITVLVDFPSLYGRICRIEGGPVISVGTVISMMDGAQFERAVWQPNNRIECSERARFFTGATRRAIELRDQCCTHRYCERPAVACQVDHIVPYAQGGLTIQENGRLLCEFHNRRRNWGPDDDQEFDYPAMGERDAVGDDLLAEDDDVRDPDP